VVGRTNVAGNMAARIKRVHARTKTMLMNRILSVCIFVTFFYMQSCASDRASANSSSVAVFLLCPTGRYFCNRRLRNSWKSTIFVVVTPCSSEGAQCFGGTWCLNIKG
jgi:hypothetical protein